jgi:hypothetical protein
MINRDFLPLKQYNLIVTGANWTTSKATGVAYKTLNGSWRIILNISGSVSATATLTLTVGGIVFTSNNQAVGCHIDNNTGFNSYATGGASTIYINSGSNFTTVDILADAEIVSKPTWCE